MIRLLVWWCVFYSCVTMGISASITTEYSDEIYDDYLYSQEQEEEQSEAILVDPRSRILFDNDEVNEQTDSSAVNFSTKDDKLDLNRKISFVIPEERLSKIELTLRELNEIFDKKKYKRGRKGKLSRQDKKTARSCRKKKLLFSVSDKKCYEPTSGGPCKNGKWFVSVPGKLQGVCRRPPCPGAETPILYNGTCSSLYDSCPPGERLYLNKRGVGFCDCDQGYSYSREHDTCYKEHTPGPCMQGQSWLRRPTPKNHRTGHKVFGECVLNKCEEGKVEWKDKKCYKVDQGEMFEICVADEKGEMVLEDNVVTCKMVMDGRAIAMGISRSCRRGRTWSRYRNRCVRVFSRG